MKTFPVESRYDEACSWCESKETGNLRKIAGLGEN